MASYENILVDRDGAVGVVTVNRPKVLNALKPGDDRRAAQGVHRAGGRRRSPRVRADRRGGQGVRRRRRHLAHAGHERDGRDRFRQIRTAPRRVHGADVQADHRRGRRLRPRRRDRAGHGLRLHLRQQGLHVRPAGDQPGDHPGLRRHPAPAAADRRRPGDGMGLDRRHDPGRGGLPGRAGQQAGRRRRSRRGEEDRGQDRHEGARSPWGWPRTPCIAGCRPTSRRASSSSWKRSA